ncbi:MAG: hypothetical protein ACYTG4_03965 [Planctomycetota bacterium]|jgi:cytochrome c
MSSRFAGFLAFALINAAATVAGAVAQDAADAEARAAEKQALALGAKVWKDKALGPKGRTCMKCHTNPKKPELRLNGVHEKYPRYDRNAGRVITLQEKFVQMQERSLKAKKTLPLGDERWTALELYLKSLK